jgi:hypothetical protein
MRLRILSDDEIDALYGRPRFTQEERNEYFTLSAQERATLGQLHSLKSRVFFILQLGYFKARRMFFVFGLRDVVEDVAHIRERYFPDFNDADPEIAKGTRLKQQQLILGLLQLPGRKCSDAGKAGGARQTGGDRLRQAWLHLPGTHALLGRAACCCSGIQRHAGHRRRGTGL